MKKVFLLLFLVTFMFNFSNAEEVKQTNELTNTEDDSSKKLLELQERLKKTQKGVEETQKRKKESQKRTEDLNKLEKTVNELNETLGIKK